MPTRGDAFDFLTARGREIFGEVRSMLYVGHRGDTSPWWRSTFASVMGVKRIGVIDILPDNLATASFADQSILGDIRDLTLIPSGYDMVFWDEGPEHLPREESLETIRKMMGRGLSVLVSCPWGFQPQGSDPTDVEFHHWGPTPEDFLSIGMSTATFGTMFPGGHGNLIAWFRSSAAGTGTGSSEP